MIKVIIIGIFGGSDFVFKNSLLLIGHLGVVIQLGINLIFVHFIAKEHILTMYDEYKTSSLSRMVDRIRGTGHEQGDPSHFLVEEKSIIINPNSKELTHSNVIVEKVNARS